MSTITEECVELRKLHVSCFVRRLRTKAIKFNQMILYANEVFAYLVQYDKKFQAGLFSHACKHALECLYIRMYDCARSTIEYIVWQWREVFEFVVKNNIK